MNRLISSLLGVLLTVSASKAQLMVGSTNLTELDIQYIELVTHTSSSGAGKLLTKTHIWVDFGQGLDTTKTNELVKSVKGGSSTSFQSATDALNYFYKNGWDLLYQYPLSLGTDYHYVLRRRYPKSK